MVTQGWALVWSAEETALAITQELIAQLTGVLDTAPRMSWGSGSQARRKRLQPAVSKAFAMRAGAVLVWFSLKRSKGVL